MKCQAGKTLSHIHDWLILNDDQCDIHIAYTSVMPFLPIMSMVMQTTVLWNKTIETNISLR